jgi:hypothetical protein
MAVTGREEVFEARMAFRRRLDHQVGGRRRGVQIGGRGQARECFHPFLGGAAPLLRRARQRLGDAIQRLLCGAGRHVEDLGAVARARGHLRDARAHRPRAHHQDPLHVEDADHQTFPK